MSDSQPKHPMMKLTQSFLFAGTVAALAFAPCAWADREPASEPAVEEPAVEEPAIEEPVIDEPVIDEPTDDGGVVDGTVVPDGEVAICLRGVDGEPVEKGEIVELTVEDGCEAVDPALNDNNGGEVVQRGGEHEMNPEIFQTTAIGGGAVADRAEPAFGSDERAAEIQSKETRGSAVKNLKKGPVALVKKGRVFLR